jgi:hypothetical protein
VTLEVSSPADWRALRENRLLTVLDPMVFRAADVFLHGAPDHGDEPVWEALSKSVDAFCAFVDAVMLNDQLPIFDYWATWQTGPGFTGTLLDVSTRRKSCSSTCA